MWLVGLIVGGVLGALVGDGVGGVLGALVGAIAGVALSIQERTRVEERWRHLEQAIAHLHLRMTALEAERRAPLPGAASDAAPAPAPASAPPAAAAPVAPAPAPFAQAPAPFAQAPAPIAPAAAPVAQAPAPVAQAPAPVAQAPAPSPELAARAAAPQTSAAPSPERHVHAGSTTPPPAEPVFPELVLPRWLLGSNTLVRVGLLVLFFGIAFLVKFAAEHGFVPIEARLAAVALCGVALLVLGWKLRVRRRGYGLMLQGGGVGVLYLTAFAALRLYALLSAPLAFALLAAIGVLAAVLSVLQDARSLAITGAIGGFLAPVLTSTGGGSHVALFGFYAVLNAGILALAYRKAWRELNLVGFVFTFGLGLLWGARYYRPEIWASIEAFLALFFCCYVAIAVLFAVRQAPRLTHYVDGTLVFGTPIAAFGLQIAVVRHFEYGAAWSAAALGVFYLALAAVLRARQRATLRLLTESFVALGVGFATVAVPLAFDARWTSAVWAVEGAAIVWTGTRQDRWLARLFGMAVQLAAGTAFLLGADRATGDTPVANGFCMGCILLAAAGAFSSRYLERHRDRVRQHELFAARALFVWAALWWLLGGFVEIDRRVPFAWQRHAELLLVAGTGALLHLLARGRRWESARLGSLCLLPMLGLLLLRMLPSFGRFRSGMDHPFASHAYLGWALGGAVHLWILRAHDRRGTPVLPALHAGGLWLLAAVLTWEAAWRVDRLADGAHVWPLLGWAIVPLALVALLALPGERLGWPVARHRAAYVDAGALPLVLFLLGWVVAASLTSPGDCAPLPYLAVLNPLDVMQAGALLAVSAWIARLGHLNAEWMPEVKRMAFAVLGAVAFVALNGALLRALHHHGGVPFRIEVMARSMLVQASLSLFWTLLALLAMVIATRRGVRALWLAGALLLAVVVAKLFLIDLASSGTVERVVSFIGVGVLVIVIGYFAPVPPRSAEA
jgi:uncharacterized membrane protein